MIFSGLVVRRGKPEDVISELVQKLGADTVQALTFQEEVLVLASSLFWSSTIIFYIFGYSLDYRSTSLYSYL